MIGNSLAEYIFIRASIVCLRAVAPLAIAYLAVSCFRSQNTAQLPLQAWASLETCFLLLCTLRKRKLQRVSSHSPRRLNRDERYALFKKCLSDLIKEDAFEGWFHASTSEITRNDVRQWITWALFEGDGTDADEAWEEEIESYINEIDAHLKHKLLPDGRGRASMRLTSDPVVVAHRPLIWYAIVALIDCCTCIFLYHLGFSHFSSPGYFRSFPPRFGTIFSKTSPVSEIELPFWYRPHLSQTKKPIIFIHGIGIGLYPYLPWLRELATSDVDVGIIVIELLPISARMTYPIPPRAAILDALSIILNHFHLETVVLAAHSYGTIIAAHVLRASLESNTYPNRAISEEPMACRVASYLFIDPIPFLLHLPPIAYNFVYRKPQEANEWQLWYFASRDPDVARALSRFFWWTDNILWREDLIHFLRQSHQADNPPNVTVVLSGKDQIVDSQAVWDYLTNQGSTRGMETEDRYDQKERKESFCRWVGAKEEDGLEVLIFPELDHATVFDTPERRQPLTNCLHKLYDSSTMI